MLMANMIACLRKTSWNYIFVLLMYDFAYRYVVSISGKREFFSS